MGKSEWRFDLLWFLDLPTGRQVSAQVGSTRLTTGMTKDGN